MPRPVRIAEVHQSSNDRVKSGIDELDRVLGGGLVPGSVVLVAGEPGIGKSTLTLQAAAGFAANGKSVLLVCGEESLEQVADRARRVGSGAGIDAVPDTDLLSLVELLSSHDVVVVDSIQTLRDPQLPGDQGSVSQVRSCAAAIGRAARASGSAVILVGHVTKDGGVAGPRTLEHLVDAVLLFEGDRGHQLRAVRSVKNRYGSTAELGVFEMRPDGLAQVSDASGLLLTDRQANVCGSVVTCMMEGRRPLAIEIQALAIDASGPARRIGTGIDNSRLMTLAAILEKVSGIILSKKDVYASAAGGLRAGEPAVDLALVLAIASTVKNKPLAPDIAAIGEVGLAGEIRGVPNMDRRIQELSRMGFRTVLVPSSASVEAESTKIVRIVDVKAAMSFAL